PATAPASKKTASKQAAPHNAPAVTAKTSSTKPASTKTKAVAEPAPAAAPGRLIPGKYYLNAGVYAEAANVNRSVKQLQALKLPTLRQTVSSSKGDLTRLRIGPFDTRKQAEQAAAKAKKLRIDATVFQQPKS
ncbi:SPOR domain-containing protein, partial [Comamonas sp.]|uniref:SPOR domain-containing protein n=1 Tax=Comamonas sp. TaxID=34028 RepID=UPI0028981CF0